MKTEEEEKLEGQNLCDKSKASNSTTKLCIYPGGPEHLEPVLPKLQKKNIGSWISNDKPLNKCCPFLADAFKTVP